MTFRNLLLKSIPYLASFGGGILVFCVAIDNVTPGATLSLLIDISASLLSIPLVFLLYDYTNSLVSRRLKKTLTTTMRDKVNILMLHLILILRKILRLRASVTLTWINSLGGKSEQEISNMLHLQTADSDLLRRYHGELENIIYRYGKERILTPEQTRVLSEMGHNISRFLNEYHIGGDRRVCARYMKEMIADIIDWLDSGAANAMDFKQLLMASRRASEKTLKRK